MHSDRCPIASAALGAVAGFPAGRLVASHFAVMTRHTAQVLIGGPALVERALGVKAHEGRTRRRGGSREERRHRQHRGRRAGRVQPDAPIPVVPAVERLGDARRALHATTTRSAPKRSCCRSCRAIRTRHSTCAASLSWSWIEVRSSRSAQRFGPSQICGFARLVRPERRRARERLPTLRRGDDRSRLRRSIDASSKCATRSMCRSSISSISRAS